MVEEKVIVKVSNGYLVKMSTGFEIQIDEKEVPKAMEAWKSGKIVRFKKGIIRGDLIAGIIFDRERFHVDGYASPERSPLSDDFRPIKSLLENTKLLQ